MLFNDLVVGVDLLIAGGLETVLQNKTDEQIQNTEKAISLSLIKNDLKIELGKSNLDFDYIATNYDYLLIEALRILQRYHIILKFGDVFDGSNAKEMADILYKEYLKIKEKFKNINLDSQVPVATINIISNYK